MALGHFTEGSVWSDGATPPAAKVLTTGLVVGDTLFVGRESEITITLILSGTAPTSLDLQWEQSIDGGTTWAIAAIGDDSVSGAQDHVLRLSLSPYTHYRLSAKRTGGDGTTALLATGQVSRTTAFPGNVDEVGALLVATGTGSSVAVEGTVAHDAADADNPVKVGYRARTSQIAAVANDDRSDAVSNAYGELVLAGYDWTAGAVNENLTHLAGTALNVNGGNRDAGTQTVTLADDDPAVVDLAAIEVLQTTIAGDTTSIDSKTPALGTAAEAASVPVTVATDDPHFGAVGAASDVDGVVHGQLRYVGEAADAIQTSVQIMDDWDNAASDGASVSGDVAHDAVDAGEPVKVGARARTSQIAAVANDDRTDLVANEYGEQVIAAYSWALNALRASIVNPVSDQYVAGQFAETAITSGTTAYHYIDMSGYRGLQFTLQITPGTDGQTVTIEATTQDDGTAAASCTYEDITQYGMTRQDAAATAANYTTGTVTTALAQGTNYKYVRIKYVIGAGAGNDAAHQFDYKAWY